MTWPQACCTSNFTIFTTTSLEDVLKAASMCTKHDFVSLYNSVLEEEGFDTKALSLLSPSERDHCFLLGIACGIPLEHAVLIIDAARNALSEMV